MDDDAQEAKLMDQRPADIFDSAAWMFASTDLCKREQISPNRLAYNKSSGTLAVIVKRSSGGDFALSQGRAQLSAGTRNPQRRQPGASGDCCIGGR